VPRRYQPQLSDFGNWTLLEDEVQRYNNTEKFHTVHGHSYLDSFHWRKEYLEQPQAAIPVT